MRKVKKSNKSWRGGLSEGEKAFIRNNPKVTEVFLTIAGIFIIAMVLGFFGLIGYTICLGLGGCK